MTTTWYERDDDANYWLLRMTPDRCISGRRLGGGRADADHRTAAAAEHYQPGTNGSLGLRLAVMQAGTLEPLEAYRHVSPAASASSPSSPAARAAAAPWWRRLLSRS